MARELFPKERDWLVEILLHAATSRFAIEIYAEEWGFAFHHGDRVSWIRITDIPFVHGQDDFGLLPETPALHHIGTLLRIIEHRFGVVFAREAAQVRTSITDGEPAIRDWLATL